MPTRRHPLAGRGQRKRDLESAIARNARAAAMPVARYRDFFCRTVLIATLELAVARGHIETYCVKGGTAIELRFGSVARATRDVDLELPVPLDRLVEVFASAIQVGCGDFTMNIKRGARPIRDEAIRIDVAMQFLELDWTTISVDLAPTQRGDFTDAVPLSLGELLPSHGLPQTARAMRTEFLIAQKLHAVTIAEPPSAYARHVVDVVFLYRMGIDLESLRSACHAIFEIRSPRDGRAWPPLVDLPVDWEREYPATIDAYGMKSSPAEISREFNNLVVVLVGGTVVPSYEYRFNILNFVTSGNPQELTLGSPVRMDDMPGQAFVTLAAEGWRVQSSTTIKRGDRASELLVILERERTT